MSGSFKCLSPSSKRFKMKREFCFKLINSPSVQAEMERATSAKDAFFPSLMHLMEDAFNEKVASNLAKDDEIEDLRRELGDARSKINKLEKKLAGLTGKACQTVNRKSDNLLPNSPLVKRGDAGPSMSSTPKRARLEMKEEDSQSVGFNYVPDTEDIFGTPEKKKTPPRPRGNPDYREVDSQDETEDYRE